MITGHDECDKWTDQSTWDAVLNNIRIVLSTHQVLVDALTHGFVKIESLSLLVFDEAHHCVKRHPANQILHNFYIPYMRSSTRLAKPAILGLTASPVTRAKTSADKELDTLEANMNAKVTVPRMHRRDLLKFVYRPELQLTTYQSHSISMENTLSPLLGALWRAVDNYDIMQDPYIISLQTRTDVDAAGKADKAIADRKTFCLKQLRRIVSRAQVILNELGVWPAEWYLRTCILRFLHKREALSLLGTDVTEPEATHLVQILAYLPTITNSRNTDYNFSSADMNHLAPKFRKLLDLLERERSPDFTGLIFVEQRATVFALAELLGQVDAFKSAYKVAPFVGMSNYSGNWADISELADLKEQQASLDAFGRGDVNLIVCTNVLEEGIDVPTCHVVICYDPPKNLKSFIQRRGRARKEKSKYILFLGEDNDFVKPAKWESLEVALQATFEDDLRAVKEVDERESEIEGSDRNFRVASTG